MNSLIAESLYVSILSLLIAAMISPILIKASIRLGWVDRPNQRKLHNKPIPVIGGIILVISFMLALTMTSTIMPLIRQYGVLMAGTLIIFITGVWDDRMDVNPKLRLMIQLACAYGVASSGIRLSSLHGFLGIHNLPLFWEYALTIVIIAGVTNSFNLMDGIDGLAGGLALINVLILAALSYVLGKPELVILLLSISGALVIFLMNNIHPAKIFMGDGGSLMLGFLMASAGIVLIEAGQGSTMVSNDLSVMLVSAILVVPVFDSLRVYTGRIARGNSPFKADKTHLHHLILILGLNHKKTSYYIYGLEIVLIIFGFLLNKFIPFSLCLILIVSAFLIVCQLLAINSGVDKWLQAIRKMENE